MKQIKKSLLPIFLITMLISCKKDKTGSEAADQLPPSTQIGANTFGCLVNGTVWIPKGFSGTGTPNPHIIYSTGLNGLPYLMIETKQIIENSVEGTIILYFFNLDHIGNFDYSADFNFSFGWSKYFGQCGVLPSDTSLNKSGVGTVTKLDLQNRIISGTFNCMFKITQCETISLSNGRFDIKF